MCIIYVTLCFHTIVGKSRCGLKRFVSAIMRDFVLGFDVTKLSDGVSGRVLMLVMTRGRESGSPRTAAETRSVG